MGRHSAENDDDGMSTGNGHETYPAQPSAPAAPEAPEAVAPLEEKPLGTAIDPAPAGGAAERGKGAGPKPERRRGKIRKLAGAAAGAAAVAGVIGGGVALFGSNDAPHKEVPQGPSVLTGPITENPLDKVTREGNNGENGKTVLTLPLTIKLGETAFKNPIFEPQGLTDEVIAQTKAGNVDPQALNGHLFLPGQPSDTPQGGKHDYNRAFTAVDVSQITGVDVVKENFRVIPVALDSQHPTNVGYQPGTNNPYEQSATGVVEQHAKAAGWAPYVIGAPSTEG